MNLDIVDSQVHIWAASTPERPWPARHQPHRPEPITAESLWLEMQEAGVSRAILVPPSWEGERNDVVLAAAQAYPERYAVMGRLDPLDPRSPERIRTWRDTPGQLGLRFTFHRPSFEHLLTEGHLNWLWPLAEKHGVPIMMTCPFKIIHLAGEIAQQHPGLKLTLDHFALLPGTKDEVAFDGFEKLLALAAFDNVAVKCSSLPCYTQAPWPFKPLHAYIKQAFEAFGPERMFWGSDLSRLTSSYRECVELFTTQLPWLKGENLEMVMGQGLRRWLGWV